MASILPGYEYDIFISYRHNDNLDGWVTEFVQNLEKELKSTLKDTLSIYFDKNPHDGLLETHHVDKSLEGKLKSLIFIPIISQTYCDPKSFAWKHEFCVFNKLTKEDQFGRDIKLGNGNVASRILPIKIHDLDEDDKSTIENELGGILRPIEFIFSSPGVNRALVTTDNPEKNLNQSFYRNQVNKAANAVKALVYAMQQRPVIAPRALDRLPEMEFENSIAVLPFMNMSSDPEQEYLCDGLSEELLNALAQIDRIKVAARTSAFSYKGSSRNIKEIGKALDVNTVLEGSVRKSGNRIRITAQIINVDDGFHIWSEKFDTEITDIFEIQDEIALAILKELKVKLLGSERTAVLKRTTDNSEAYQYFLQGRFHYYSTAEDGYQVAIKCLDKAIELDPSYARAYAFRASCYFNLWLFVLLPSDESLPLAKQSMNKALELDDQTEEAHYALARYKLWVDYDLESAEKELQITLNLNPNIPEAISHYALLQNFRGYQKKAILYARKAKKLDPFSPLVDLEYLTTFWLAGKFEEMHTEALKSIKLFPQFWGGYWIGGYYYWTRKEYPLAIEYFEKALECFPGQMSIAELGCLYGVAGQKEKALEKLAELEQLASKGHVGSIGFAFIYAGLGDFDKAFPYFEVAAQERYGDMIFLDFYARDLIPAIKQDARFQPLMEKSGVPVYRTLD